MGMFGRTRTVADAVRSSDGRHPLGQRLKAILPMLRDAVTGRWSAAPRGRLALSLLGLLYVISPLDVLPELLLGPFGLGDDLAIAAVAVAALMSTAEEWLDRVPTASATTSPASGDVIQGIVLDRG